MGKRQRKMVRDVVVRTHYCLLTGEQYKGERDDREPISFIDEGSMEQNIITDEREKGLSLTETQDMVNKYRKQHKLSRVTRSAVWSCEQRMINITSKIEKRPQGNLDPTSTWAKARHR